MTKVTKRNGKQEELNIEKIHKVLFWATSGLKNVSVSDIEMHASLQFEDGIETKKIHQVLINSAVDLITAKTPEYSSVASRLLNYLIRKEKFGTVYELPHLETIINTNVDNKIYDPLLQTAYSKEEIDMFNDLIKHDRDFELSYAGIQQVFDKYLCKDRISGKIHELPQYAFMCISMMIFANEQNKDKRQKLVRRTYNSISNMKLCLPTPILAGVRTPLRQYSSCTLINVGDSLTSILNADYAVGIYTAKRAGIGLNVGNIRGEGEAIRGGEVKHTGMIPLLKKFQGTCKSMTQGSVRTGSTNTFYPWWHKEFEELIVLKNNKGTDDNRVRQLDYTVQLNDLFFKRCKENKDITLFPTGGKPEFTELYQCFFEDSNKFETLYVQLEQKYGKKYKNIKARNMLSTICKERHETGRIYPMFVENTNKYGPFKDKIFQLNLCQEISLPSMSLDNIESIMNTPDYDIDKYDDEIALCVLSAINLGKINNDADLEDVCDIAVRFLDNVIECQDYPINAAKKMLKRRSLGVGLTNFAYWLTKNKLTYSDDKNTLGKVDELMEKFQYYLLKSSCNLAKEIGPCDYFNKSKYSDGILPIDRYKKTVDELITRTYSCDWETLRKDIATYGLRNSTCSSIQPCEASAQVSGSTNGIEPPRKAVVVKNSKDGPIKMTVPDVKKLEGLYNYAFENIDNKGYLSICAVIQKWIDQAISANTYYNPYHPLREKQGEINLDEVAKDIMFANKYGLKSLYYSNTNDAQNTEEREAGCSSGNCSV